MTAKWYSRDVANGARHEEIILVLHAAGSASGRVVDAGGTPVPFIRVNARQFQDPGIEYASKGGVADKDGRFHFERLIPGRWGFDTQGSRKPVRIVEFEIAPNTEALLPDIVLAPATSVCLRLLGEDGKPLAAGLEVKLDVTREQPMWHDFFTERADAEGCVTFHGIEPGTLEAKVTVKGLDYEVHRLTLQIVEGQENDIGEIRLRWARDKAE